LDAVAHRFVEAVLGHDFTMKLAWAGILLLCAACVGPARSYGVYESRAAQSADAARSAVQTARAGIEDAAQGDAFAAYVSALLSDAEDTASTAEGHFASIQPPDAASDQLRSDLLPMLQNATNEIEQARIAARRDDVRALVSLGQPLASVNDALASFLDQHQS
jgi:hypothetical protein